MLLLSTLGQQLYNLVICVSAKHNISIINYTTTLYLTNFPKIADYHGTLFYWITFVLFPLNGFCFCCKFLKRYYYRNKMLLVCLYTQDFWIIEFYRSKIGEYLNLLNLCIFDNKLKLYLNSWLKFWSLNWLHRNFANCFHLANIFEFLFIFYSTILKSWSIILF